MATHDFLVDVDIDGKLNVQDHLTTLSILETSTEVNIDVQQFGNASIRMTTGGVFEMYAAGNIELETFDVDFKEPFGSVYVAFDTISTIFYGNTTITEEDITLYNKVINANPTFSIGASATERFGINAIYNIGTTVLDKVEFRTSTGSGLAEDGRMEFYVDDVQKFKISDSFVEVWNIDLHLWEGKKVIFDGDADTFAYIFSDTSNIAGKGISEFIIATTSTDNDVHFVDGETFAYVSAVADAFVTDGGTASQFVKGDGTLDSTTYITSASIEDWIRADVADIKTSGDLTFNDSVAINLGTGNDTDLYFDSSNTYMRLSAGDFYIQDLGVATRFTFGRTTGDFTATGDIRLATNATYLYADVASGSATRIHGINASNIEYIGSVDQAVTNTIIGNNTSSVQFNLGNVSHGNFTSSGNQTTLNVGRPDDQQGVLALNGVGTGEGTSGGQVWLRAAADHDTTFDRYQIVVSADDLLIGGDTDADLFAYYGGTDHWEFNNAGGVLIGVGESTPACRFHIVDEDNLLGGTTGNSQEFRRLQFRGGSGGNDVKIQEYAVRDATGTTWTTLRYHNSIGVDTSFLTPGTDSRVFWERDPNNQIQHFGSGTNYTLAIDSVNNRVGVNIGNQSPDATLHVEDTKNNAIIRTTSSTNDTSWVDGDIYGSFEMYSLDGSNGGAGLVGYVRAVNESTTTGNRSDLVFGNRDASSMVAEKMRIDYLGNIRFGLSASPTTLSFAPNGGTDPYISYVDGTGFVMSNQSGDSFVIQDAATEIFRVNNEGDVTADGEFTGFDRTRKNITDDATTTHTVASADAGICRRFTSSSSITVTVDTGSLTNIGETAEIDQYGTGLVTIAAGTATLRVNGNATLVSSGQYSRISIQKMTSTEYRVFGELEPA